MPIGTPSKAPYPVEKSLKPSAEDQSTIPSATCDLASSAPCRIPVQVGLFFDGTNNDLERDPNGRQFGLIDPSTTSPTAIRTQFVLSWPPPTRGKATPTLRIASPQPAPNLGKSISEQP